MSHFRGARPVLLGLLWLASILSGCENPVSNATFFPEIQAQGWLNGNGPSSSELRGKVAVIDVWAYWCGPCRRAAPGLVQTYDHYKNRGVVFVGLTMEGVEAVEKSATFLRDTGISWPNAYGAGSTVQALGVTAIPIVFVVGADGQIRWNSMMGGNLNQAIDRALAETPRT